MSVRTASKWRRVAPALGLAVAVLGFTGGTGAAGATGALQRTASTTVSSAPVVTWTTFGPTFDQPVQMLTAHDGLSRYFVVQKTGMVRVVQNHVLLPHAYLDVADLPGLTFNADGERGLLSIAFPPNFVTWPYVFSTHTDAAGNLIVSRWGAVTHSANVLLPTHRVTVLVVAHGSQTNHNGGQLMFGKDGDLYISTGDGGGAGDPYRSAQNLADLRGKILRINVMAACSGHQYCVPSTNPFVLRSGARPEIWAYGMRNPWRFSVDRLTGDLWVGNVGQDAWESVDHILAGHGGYNAGWSICEGTHSYNGTCPFAGFNPPIIEYCHPDNAGCSNAIGGDAVTGGVVVRGVYPKGQGRYLYGDYGNGNIWLGGTAFLQAQQLPGVAAIGQDDPGDIFAADVDDGHIYLAHIS
jgi:glucose/arabinose dehydrogenase